MKENGHRHCDRCGALLTKDNNKCGFEICDRCNDILEKSTEKRMTNEQHIENLKKLLEQEPCEDEYIKVPKKALKYRTAGMVAYNVAWLREHWQMEMDIVYGVKPCDDAISRATVCETYSELYDEFDDNRNIQSILHRVYDNILSLPPVKPQPKTGHWIKDDITERSKSAYKHKCDRCGAYHRAMYDYCPSCGAKMFEPQETETWNGYHGQITAPKGTFERIFNEADDDNDI